MSFDKITPGDWIKIVFALVVVIGGYASLHLVVQNTSKAVKELPNQLAKSISQARQELLVHIETRRLFSEREFQAVRKEIEWMRSQYVSRDKWREIKGEYDGWRRTVDNDLRRLQPDNPRIGQNQVIVITSELQKRISRAERQLDKLSILVEKSRTGNDMGQENADQAALEGEK